MLQITHHPITPLIRLILHQLHKQRLRLVILLAVQIKRQLLQLLDGIRFEQVLVVEVVEQDVEPLFRVRDVLSVLCGRARFHALHVGVEDVVDGARGFGDVGAVTGRCWGG